MFHDGTCALRWRTAHKSTALYDCAQEMMAIHGHAGATSLKWLDEESLNTTSATPFERGAVDAYQDRCEGCMFASIGGVERRTDPQRPKYISPDQSADYLRGYEHMSWLLHGDDWRTMPWGA